MNTVRPARKRTVLFVDDEPQVLDGLRARLHRQRAKWDMKFVNSGAAALELLARTPVDVLVTDMRMPEMDGAALLRQVQARHPRVVRIVLSGHSELETTLRAIPVAHQFLSKPCDVGVIENVIERACALHALIGDEAVRQRLGGIESLPAVPRIYAQLSAALATEHASVEQVAQIIKQDLAMSAKALQMVNSAFFRLSRSIARIEEAVSYLGFTTVKQIVLAVEVFHNAKPGPLLDALQVHSVEVATLASRLFTDRGAKEDAFVAGLLHDIGKLVLHTHLPDHLEHAQEQARSTNSRLHIAEYHLWGVTHAEVGGYLLGLWGLPYPVVEAVANHHEPWRVDTSAFGLLWATHLADALLHEVAANGAEVDGNGAPFIHRAFLERLAPSAAQLQDWRKLARDVKEGKSR